MNQILTNKTLIDLIKTLEDFFAKAPALPANIREIIVKITPWLALVFGILGVLGGIGALGLSPMASVAGVDASFMVLLAGIFSIIGSALMLVAFPKLKEHKMDGWKLLFLSQVVGVISSVVSGAILGAVIGGLIGFYFLYQIKSYYK
jgi:hypothetical protein